MKPIDGDRLKELLDDTEDMLRSINSIDHIDLIDTKSWDMYLSALRAVFMVVRETIDRMPVLRTPMDYMER